jgi:hypothetical protein
MYLLNGVETIISGESSKGFGDYGELHIDEE